MVDSWLVLGGWGASPLVLAPLFRGAARFVASDEIMPRVIREGTLAPDWPRILLDSVAPKLPAAPFGIAGWSAGAILAYALANEVKPAACVFLSATPCFCRGPEFPYGQKSLVLKAMREQLASDPEAVLRTFHARCGIPPGELSERHAPNRDAMTAGLLFLEHAALLPVQKLSCPSLFLHGKNDSIVPVEAGEYFCRESGGVFAEFDGPHAFFMTRYREIAAVIGERT